MSSRELDLLRDLLPALLERGRQAGAEARQTSGTDADGVFERGRAQAYYEVLSCIVNQLDAFGVERDGVGLPARLDLEDELLVK